MKNIIFGFILATVCFGLLVFFLIGQLTGNKPLTRDECFRLGSNERTKLCLLELEERNKPVPQATFDTGVTVLNTTASPGFLTVRVRNDSIKSYSGLWFDITYLENGIKDCEDKSKVLDTEVLNHSEALLPGEIKQFVIPHNPDINQPFEFCVGVQFGTLL